MRGREILLVVLVVAIALGSGLIGLYLGRASVQTQAVVAPTGGGPSVGPAVAVSAQDIKLYDKGQVNLLFTISGQRIYQGNVQDGNVVLSFDGRTIRRGAAPTGEELFTVQGGVVFVGPDTTGPRAYTIDSSGKVHEGGPTGTVIYTIEGNKVFEGTKGNILFDANVDLASEIWPVVPVLLDRRF